MNDIVKHSVRFFSAILVQVLLLNQIEIGFGIQLMIYPLFILLLPVETKVISLLFISFGLGILIDVFSNTYGLHASAALMFAFIRPRIFKLFDTRDGYDALVETNIFNMGLSWFLRTFGTLLFIHHFWFFLIEMFKMNEIAYVFQKTLLSLPISFAICVLLQSLFVKNQTGKQ
ncbi:MAG TPA: hypothetical protein EYG86_05650 [Crocinitomicaceae bacterium]|nr:hypothetical protein [Crocinitomicaceae bacterium]